jgi:hypothetical protein
MYIYKIMRTTDFYIFATDHLVEYVVFALTSIIMDADQRCGRYPQGIADTLHKWLHVTSSAWWWCENTRTVEGNTILHSGKSFARTSVSCAAQILVLSVALSKME